jgi:hypothetical protein
MDAIYVQNVTYKWHFPPVTVIPQLMNVNAYYRAVVQPVLKCSLLQT